LPVVKAVLVMLFWHIVCASDALKFLSVHGISLFQERSS